MSFTSTKNEEYINYLKKHNIYLDDFLEIYIKTDSVIRDKLTKPIDNTEIKKMFKKLLRDNKENKDTICILKSDIVSTIDTKVTYNKSIIDNLITTIDNKVYVYKNTIEELVKKHSSGIILDENVNEEFKKISTQIINDRNNILEETNDIKDLLNKNYKLMSNLFCADNKKGRTAETAFYHKLKNIYGEENIHFIGNEAHTCDIRITLLNRPPVLLELKNYNSTVPTIEVNKFLEDCDAQNTCGILASINNGIVKKDHFSFDIKENRITVYLHCINYDAKYISMALNVIFGLHNLIQKYGGNVYLSLDEIEYKELKNEYLDIIGFLNNLSVNLKKQIIDIENLKQKELHKFFSKTCTQNIITGCQYGYIRKFKCPENSCTHTAERKDNLKRHINKLHPHITWKNISHKLETIDVVNNIIQLDSTSAIEEFEQKNDYNNFELNTSINEYEQDTSINNIKNIINL